MKKFASKNIISLFCITLLFTFSFSLAKADTGKIIPDEFLWLLVIGFVSLLVFVVFFISTLIKLLFRRNNKKDSGKLVLIILLTILPPIIWLYAEANYHLLFSIETTFGYRVKEIFSNVISVVVSMLGMALGFLVKKLFG
jgi:hypothetical protein